MSNVQQNNDNVTKQKDNTTRPAALNTEREEMYFNVRSLQN